MARCAVKHICKNESENTNDGTEGHIMKKKSKKGLIFVVIAVIIVVIFVKKSKNKKEDKPDTTKQPITIENRDDGIFVTAMMGENTTVGGIDYFIVKIFNTETNNLDFVVIPERCYLTMSSGCYQTLSSKNADLMASMNLSSIALYFNKEARYENTIIALEDILGLEVDYYEVFSEEEFIQLINLVTPLNYDLKTNISYINRKGVSVEVPAGMQYIDGENALAIIKAEDSYESKIDQANEMCGYLNQYYSFIFSLNSLDKLKEYYSYVFEIMQSDAVYDDYAPYLEKLYNVNPDEISFHIVVGGLVEDGRYFIDSVQMQQLVQEIIAKPAGAGKEVISTEDPSASTSEGDSSEENSDDTQSTENTENTEQSTEEPATEPEEPQGMSTKEAVIQIQNSTFVNGLAKKWQTKLNTDGYQVTSVTNYKGGGGTLEATKIIVNNASLGEDLKTYFPSAIIETGEVPAGYDVVIILSSQDTTVN